MLRNAIKRLVSKLNGLLLLVTLTGFVCTHKITAEEECLSSNVLCYECDSRYDSNCADPFLMYDIQTQPVTDQNHTINRQSTSDSNGNQIETIVNQTVVQTLVPRALPPVNHCHGCCVKLTSKTPEGNNYVKRTCTTQIQINYFMVGLVCMKESGDRGKICFCEQDYCNAAQSSRDILQFKGLTSLSVEHWHKILLLFIAIVYPIISKQSPNNLPIGP